MSGFQAPAGFSMGGMSGWGMPQVDPNIGLLDLNKYGGGNTGALSFDGSGFGAIPSQAGAPGGGGFMSGIGDWFKDSGMLTSVDKNGVSTQGWGTPVLGAANGLLSAFMGMKQYGLAKDSLNEGKRQFQLNYDAQRQTTNTQLEDRQRARVASNSGAYQSVGDYMRANGVRG